MKCAHGTPSNEHCCECTIKRRRQADENYNSRLREVSQATIDAKLFGAGFIMFLPDDSFRYISADRISIKP